MKTTQTTEKSGFPVNAETPIGTPVKHSESSIRPKRDYWLSCGRPQQKSSAREELDRMLAQRGTLTGVKKGQYATFAVVSWDDGSTSECLFYMIQTA